MSDAVQACLSLTLCAAALCILFSGRRAVWTTTLRAGWCWAVLTLVIVAAVEMLIGFSAGSPRAQAELIRFATAVFVFAPTMALLGAKRPQNAAWQFVVVTLWGVLALPALESWVRGRGEELVIDPVRSWFFVVMIAVGAANHFPTRFGIAAAQFALAQALLLWPHLPLVGSNEVRPPVWIACGLLLTAAFTARRAAGHSGRSGRTSGDRPLRPWSFVWHEFRDWFGTVWGLRVMERVNASATVHGWPIVLIWDGFDWRHADPRARNDQSVVSSDSPCGGAQTTPTRLTLDQQAAIEQMLRNLLRRFVSAEWIEKGLTSRSP